VGGFAVIHPWCFFLSLCCFCGGFALAFISGTGHLERDTAYNLGGFLFFLSFAFLFTGIICMQIHKSGNRRR